MDLPGISYVHHQQKWHPFGKRQMQMSSVVELTSGQALLALTKHP